MTYKDTLLIGLTWMGRLNIYNPIYGKDKEGNGDN